MQALLESLSTLPYTFLQYPQLRALFGLGNRRGASQGLISAISATRLPSRTSPLLESTHPSTPSVSECTICYGESGDADMALKAPTEGCTHPPQVCTTCLQQVILAAISSGDFVTGIMCPSYGCPQRLGYHDVQKCAAQEAFNRWVPSYHDSSGQYTHFTVDTTSF
jgi:hypothetical protein